MNDFNEKNESEPATSTLFILPDDKSSERIIRHLATYEKDFRLLVDNLHDFKPKIFDVYEKFDAIYDYREFEMDEKNFSKEFDSIITLKNGQCVKKIMIFSPSNENFKSVEFLNKFKFLKKNLQLFNLLSGCCVKKDEFKIILFNYVEEEPVYDTYKNQAYFLDNFLEDTIIKLGYKFLVFKTPNILDFKIPKYKKKSPRGEESITYSNLFSLIDQIIKNDEKNLLGENKIILFNHNYFQISKFLKYIQCANYYSNIYKFLYTRKNCPEKLYIKEKKIDKSTFLFGKNLMCCGLTLFFSAFLLRKYSL